MKSEEIYIDNVNVAECSEYSKYREGYCGWYMSCKQEGSCSFKLNWLKKENEKLKNKNNDLIEEIASGNIDIAILQKENKEILKQLEFSRTHKIVLDAERIKYKKALENIKQFLIYADHSITGNKYLENVEKALNIANEVLNEQK